MKECTEVDLCSKFQLPTAVGAKASVERAPKLTKVNGRILWTAVVVVSGCFHADFNLRSFPFDCQPLQIILEMGTIKQMRYRAPSHTDVCVSIETQICSLTEWKLAGSLVEFTASALHLSKSGNRYAQLILTVSIARCWEPYIFRLACPLAILSACSLLAFSIDPDSPSDRLSFLITLILTVVAFHFVVADTLPQTPYLTWFEKYCGSLFLFLFLPALQAACLPLDSDPQVDRAFYAAMGTLWLAAHLVALVSGAYIRQHEYLCLFDTAMRTQRGAMQRHNNIKIRTVEPLSTDQAEPDFVTFVERA